MPTSPEAERLELATRSGRWIFEIGTGRLEVSPGILALLAPETPPQNLSIDWILAHLSTAQSRRARRAFARGMASGKPFTWVLGYTTSDGAQRHAELDVHPEPGAQGLALAGVARDVTDLVVLRQNMERLEERHRLIFEQSIDVISQVDRQGHFVFVSPAAEQLFGFRPAEVTGRKVAEFTHPDDFPMLLENSRTWRFDRSPRTLQYRARAKDRDYVWIESVIRPLIDPATNQVLGALSISRDIRERRRAEEELRRARERSEAASRAKSAFLANMSHELRTPLNAIIGFSELLGREMFGPLGNERYKEYSSLILESGRHLLDLINDILDMSKIEAGRYVLSTDAIDLEELLGSTVRMVHHQSEAKNLSIALKVNALTAPLIADQRAVKQIIINLLSNAIKFTPAGGQIKITASESEAYVTIAVADTGIGIPQSEIGRLARPFEQVRSDSDTTHGGTGLGLALVRSLARLHGGEIEIESREGEGTTVLVHLPQEPIKKPATRVPKIA